MADLTKKNNIEAIVNKITELSRDDKSNLLNFLKNVINKDIDLSDYATMKELNRQIGNTESKINSIIKYNGKSNIINITNSDLNKVIYYNNANDNVIINNNITNNLGFAKLIMRIVPTTKKYTITFPKDKYIKYYNGSVKLSEIDNTKEYILIALMMKQADTGTGGISYLTTILNIIEITI